MSTEAGTHPEELEQHLEEIEDAFTRRLETWAAARGPEERTEAARGFAIPEMAREMRAELREIELWYRRRLKEVCAGLEAPPGIPDEGWLEDDLAGPIEELFRSAMAVRDAVDGAAAFVRERGEPPTFWEGLWQGLRRLATPWRAAGALRAAREQVRAADLHDRAIEAAIGRLGQALAVFAEALDGAVVDRWNREVLPALAEPPGTRSA